MCEERKRERKADERSGEGEKRRVDGAVNEHEGREKRTEKEEEEEIARTSVRPHGGDSGGVAQTGAGHVTRRAPRRVGCTGEERARGERRVPSNRPAGSRAEQA